MTLVCLSFSHPSCFSWLWPCDPLVHAFSQFWFHPFDISFLVCSCASYFPAGCLCMFYSKLPSSFVCCFCSAFSSRFPCCNLSVPSSQSLSPKWQRRGMSRRGERERERERESWKSNEKAKIGGTTSSTILSSFAPGFVSSTSCLSGCLPLPQSCWLLLLLLIITSLFRFGCIWTLSLPACASFSLLPLHHSAWSAHLPFVLIVLPFPQDRGRGRRRREEWNERKRGMKTFFSTDNNVREQIQKQQQRTEMG